jgi:YVTN family beta-propeller protein
MTARARLLLASFLALLPLAPAAHAASSFVEFESGQTRPLALSPDHTLLFAVNTPDDRLEIFDVSTGSATPPHVASVPVGLEPVAVAARTNDEVWVVNHLSDSVSIVDVATGRVTRTLLVGDEPRDIVFAKPLDGSGFPRRAFITCAHRGQNSGVPLADLTTPGIGRADVWVFDGTNLGSSLGGTPISGTPLVLFGDTPRALAVSPDGNTVYAAVFHSGNQTTAINEGSVCNGGAAAGSCAVGPSGFTSTAPGGLPAPNDNSVHVAGPETGLVVKFNGTSGHWEDRLGRNWDQEVRFSLPDQDVFQINASANPSPVTTGSFSHVGTVIFNMATNPATGELYVTNTEARNEIRFEGPGTYAATVPGVPAGPKTVRGHLHEARVTVISGPGVHPVLLNSHIDYNVVPSPAGVKDDSLATPTDMVVTSDGNTMYVSAFGSKKVGIVSVPALECSAGIAPSGCIAFVPSSADHIPLAAGGPSGLALDESRSRLYVLTRFDDGLSVIDTSTAQEIGHLTVHNPEPASITNGRHVLYDAYNTSSNGEASCSSCHIFGDFDSLAWDLGNPDDGVLNNPNPFRVGPVGDPDFHPLKGPMTTQTLRGMANDGPMHWRGDRTGGNDPGGSALDENAAFLKFIVAFDGLLGRGSAISGTDMQDFATFILQVTLPPNPNRALDDSLTSDQSAGRNFFNTVTSDTVTTCNGCHALNSANGNFGTDGFSSFENETQQFKIPHLRNLYEKVGMFGMPAIGSNANTFINPGSNGCVTGAAGCPTAASQPAQVRGFGFLHDGSVDTLFRFHNATVFNGGFGGDGTSASANTLRRQVEQFMLAFDSNLAPIVGQQITLSSTSSATVGTRIGLILARAGAGECDVVVKGNVGGQQRGWVRTAAGTFQSDRTGEPLLTDTQLRAQAATAGQELTYTAVPPGSGTRIGIDRDGDGFPDRTELDAGSDPADPASVPSGSTTTTTSSGSTTTTTSTTIPASGASRCTSKRFGLAGKKAKSRAKCYAKSITVGSTVDPTCLDAAGAKFAASWTKLLKPGNDCPTVDANDVETLVDAFTDGLASSLAPNTTPSRCSAKEMLAAAKKAAAKAKCWAKAAAKATSVDVACLDKASNAFTKTWTKLQAMTDCQTNSDAASVESDVDQFVTPLQGTLEP